MTIVFSKKRLFTYVLLGVFFSVSTAFAVDFSPKNPFYQNSFTATGSASWYGPKFHGKTTANGELYNMYGLTAAHKTLAFGTVLHVTNTKSKKTVLVQVNDRGPYVGKRIIDLSQAAMNILAGSTAGVINVELMAVSDESGKPIDPSLAYYVRCSKSLSKSDAEQELDKLHKVGIFDGNLFTFPDYYLVGLGPFETFQEAQDELIRLITIFPLSTIDLAPKQSTSS